MGTFYERAALDGDVLGLAEGPGLRVSQGGEQCAELVDGGFVLGAEGASPVVAAAEETLHRVASCVEPAWMVPLAGVLSTCGKWTWRCSTSTWWPRSRSARARILVRPLALFRTTEDVRGVRDDPDMLVMSDGARVVARRPTKPKISAAIANLQRGDVVIVERVVAEDSGDWYVQVLMREDNTFQLEYRDGAPTEHYQTRTEPFRVR
ncbi:hypothetical protein ACFZB2_40600 [Streptomyces bobili]|uniref:hypothetical protein n=1 Tax=Streptomyces bobili TaxID=67280 RepID=UPI0036E848CA